jgi:hypothetical protein
VALRLVVCAASCGGGFFPVFGFFPGCGENLGIGKKIAFFWTLRERQAGILGIFLCCAGGGFFRGGRFERVKKRKERKEVGNVRSRRDDRRMSAITLSKNGRVGLF